MKIHAVPAPPAALGWATILLLSIALGASPAQARKECRDAPGEAPAEHPSEREDRWPHDVQYDWHHEGAGAGWLHGEGDPSWVHADGDADWVHDAGDGSWVHETNYGWWLGVPDAALQGRDPDAREEDRDCTVSRERNECVVLGNQVARYSFQLALAREREDGLWESSLLDTIARLETRGALYECPWVEPSLQEKIRVTLDAVVKAVGVASQVAAMLYRMGLF